MLEYNSSPHINTLSSLEQCYAKRNLSCHIVATFECLMGSLDEDKKDLARARLVV